MSIVLLYMSIIRVGTYNVDGTFKETSAPQILILL